MRDKKWSNLMESWLKTPVAAPNPNNFELPPVQHAQNDDVALMSEGPSSLDTLDLDLAFIERQRSITPETLLNKFPDFAVTDPAATHITIWSKDRRGARLLLASFTVQTVMETSGGVNFVAPESALSLCMQLHHGKRISDETSI